MLEEKKKPENIVALWLIFCLQPHCYGEPSDKIERVCVRLTWQGQKDSNPRHVVLELKHMFVKRYYLVTFNIKQSILQTSTCIIR